MLKPLALMVPCIVGLLAPSQLWAWNSIGHMAVAKLAYDKLDDGGKARLFELLKSHPHFNAFLAAGRPADVEEVEWVIIRSAIWPDWVRPRRNDTRGADVTKYHRGEEHYVNVPFIDPKDADAFTGKTPDPDLTNVICALKQRCNDLRTKTAGPEDKAVAICRIFHLIGDIHQPMHNVAYFSNDPAFLEGDLGGNKFGVRINNRKWKLHAYWDDLLGEDASYTNDSAEHQAKVFKQAMDVAVSLRNVTLADAENDKLTKNTTIQSWSQESFELAKSVAYQKPDGSGILDHVAVNANGTIPNTAPEAGVEYAKKAKAVAEVRVVLAGNRLAERIKALLK
jgi:S1/P1 Nuclease